MPRGWRDVPMPSGIARLPRTTSGIPVGYAVSWSTEKVRKAAA